MSTTPHPALRVLVWNEFQHERKNAAVAAMDPDGIHSTIAQALGRTPALGHRAQPLQITTATQCQPEHGLTEARLAATDVLLWWGHKDPARVDDAVVDRVQRRVPEGMGLIVLHSGHFSKIFRRRMGTHCSLKWREAHEKERLWVVERSHPIAAGLGEYFALPNEEMYGERFDIPAPDTLVLLSAPRPAASRQAPRRGARKLGAARRFLESWFAGGKVFRSGCCWQRGHGRVFNFRPGREAYPTCHDANVQRVLANAVQWAAPRVQITDICPETAPLEPLSAKTGAFARVGIVQAQEDLR